MFDLTVSDLYRKNVEMSAQFYNNIYYDVRESVRISFTLIIKPL